MADTPKTSVFVRVLDDMWTRWDSALYKLSEVITQKNLVGENDLGSEVSSTYVVVRQRRAKQGSPETLIYLAGPEGKVYMSIAFSSWPGVHDHKSTLQKFGYPLQEEEL